MTADDATQATARLAATDPPGSFVIRQAMASGSPVWSNSPDIIVTGAAPAFDPGSLINTGTYDWYFSRAPVIGAANSLYVRAVNYTATGAWTSRAYLYYVESDQLLDPSKWQSTGFTVGGTAQNWVALTAVNQYQLVIAGASWTPPKPTTAGATYYLITWVDNSTSPQPPKWPATPFANLDALGAYVAANPTMAVLDTTYRGAFLRQYPAQTVDQDGTGAQTSPDLIVTGASAAQDASAFTGSSSYSPGAVSARAAVGGRNFVYVRAINTAAGPATARVYLYWATTGAIAAPSWQGTNFTVAGQPQNWVDLSATAANQVMVTTVPVVWNVPALTDGTSYVLIAYVDNSGNPSPPDFSPFGYLNPAAVTLFVAGHPQLAWVAITGTPAPAVTMSWEMPLAVGTGTNKVYAGIQLTNIPTDGTLSLSIPGPDAADTIVVPSMRVPDPDALVAWPVTYPDHFATSAVLTYTRGATPVGSANIVAALVPRSK